VAIVLPATVTVPCGPPAWGGRCARRASPMARKVRSWLLGLLLLLLGMGCFLGRPVLHLARTWWNDKDEVAPAAPGHVDDASRLNETRVAEEWHVPAH